MAKILRCAHEPRVNNVSCYCKPVNEFRVWEPKQKPCFGNLKISGSVTGRQNQCPYND